MRVLQKIKDFYEDIIFKNRNPIVKPLVEDDFSLSDEDLALKAEENISKALETAKGSYNSKADRLPSHRRIINTLIALDRDVSNGGFHQFFTNAGGMYDTHLIEDIALLNEEPLSQLMSKVWAQYNEIDYADPHYTTKNELSLLL